MNLVHKEFIKFLNDKGINTKEIGLSEGYYWYDRQIIKAYDKQGVLHKIARIEISDDLDIKIKTIYKNKPFEIESWMETVERNKERLEDFEDASYHVIRKFMNQYSDYEIYVPVSGGKDSTVVEYIINNYMKENNINKVENIVFSNTSNETHHTYKYIKKTYPNANIISPNEGFYPSIERTGFIPTKFARQCCTTQKEMPMIQQLDKNKKILFFMGMRQDESARRSAYTHEWKNEKWGKRNWIACLPILEWDTELVYLYMLHKNIPFNDIYKLGYGRCGCTYCPYRNNIELALNRYFLPKYETRWQEILTNDFIKNGKATVLNCSLKEYINGAWRGGTVRDIATNEIISEYAEYKGLDIEIAKKYFNKTCSCCEGKVIEDEFGLPMENIPVKLKKDEIALSMKYFGRQVNKLMCFKCLGKELGKTEKELKEKIKDFKNDGCSLF